MSLGSLTVAMPEAGDFVQSLEPYQYCYKLYQNHDTLGNCGGGQFFKQEGLALCLQPGQK
jgi:hypothetical protein